MTEPYFELVTPFPCLLGHILQPADDGHAVALTVAVVDKALASVFGGIVGQGSLGDRIAGDSFFAADGDGANAFLKFAHLDGQAFAKGQLISVLLLGLVQDVPNLIMIDDVILGESYQPVARKRVAPIGVGDASCDGISFAYAIDEPHAGIADGNPPGCGGQGVEHQREVYLAVLRNLDGLAQLHAYGIPGFVGLAVGLQL